jgi:hypothetical protein
MDKGEGEERISVRLCVSFTYNRVLKQRSLYLLRARIGCVKRLKKKQMCL